MALLARRLSWLRPPAALSTSPARPIFGVNQANDEMAYSEKRVVGFSREQMFEVVSNVSEYKEFVPWCRKSNVAHAAENAKLADLEIGFPPLLETYQSRVITVKPSVVHSVCTDDRIFRTLDTTWRFGPGKDDKSCTLHFDLVFQFQSAMHARIAHLFFDKVVKTMVGAFMHRAEAKFGKPSRPHSPPKILQYKS